MSLTLILAPMFAGKTSYLLNKMQAMLNLGFSCLFVNHEFDNRNENNSISCHNKIIESGLDNLYSQKKLVIIKTSDLDSVVSFVKDNIIDFIFIDEFQFFSPSNTLPIIHNLIKDGYHVFVAGLKGDSNNNKFGYTIELVPMADTIVPLTSCCVICAQEENKIAEASFTKFIGDDGGDIEKEQILVGADEKYIPVCRKHL